MKSVIHRLNANPKYSRIFEWGKIISITGSAQILVQILTLVSGILIIRFLPTKEYALYTLANTMLGTMTVLADAGVSTGVLAQSGKYWNDKKKLGSVINTGLGLRRMFGIISLSVSIPILIYFLVKNGGTPWNIVFVSVSLIPAFYAALSDSILEIVPKLHQNVRELQKNQVTVGLLRLILTCGFLFLFPFTYLLILASGLPRIFGNIRLRKITMMAADLKEPEDKEVRVEILQVVKRMLPNILYITLSGQIIIWLVSIFGNTSSIAQAGALSRLTMVLAFFNIMFATLILPRFARLPDLKGLLLKNYLIIHLGFLMLTGLIVLCVILFPGPILWILGGQYKNLNIELLLIVLGSCFNILAGVSFALYSSRGWIINPFLGIPVNILTIIVAIIFIDVSSLKGVLLLNMIIGMQGMLFNFLFGIYKLTIKKREHG
jgi:O-antigen/teichoic acid export membrane protein